MPQLRNDVPIGIRRIRYERHNLNERHSVANNPVGGHKLAESLLCAYPGVADGGKESRVDGLEQLALVRTKSFALDNLVADD